MKKTYFIKTFGCQMNVADSERIAAALEKQDYKEIKNVKKADLVVINSCIVRESAENRIYGLINKLSNIKWEASSIILTGCLAGWALRDKAGKNLKKLKKRIGNKIKIVLTEDLTDLNTEPKRLLKEDLAYIPISNGCNHFCSYCIVPYARGLETYRSTEAILKDVHCAVKQSFSKVMLLGQNVNSWNPLFPRCQYGDTPEVDNFPRLLEVVAQIKGVEKLSFMSANPWDFSDELIEVITQNANVSREIHLPVQSGDDEILRKMNRPYTAKKYLKLINKIRTKIPKAQFTTDIIVGFPGETKKAFQNTVKLCKKAGFKKAFIAKYSPRPSTAAVKLYQDNISSQEKKKRWRVLENLIND